MVAEIRESIEDHWGSHRRVVEVQIRRIEGNAIYGFVSLVNGATRDSFLLDFEAKISPRGAISFLRVDGKTFPTSAKRRAGGRA